MASGVEFGHVDQEWLFDCLEVGSITIGTDQPYTAPCLYLGPKGLFVAEEYLEARFKMELNANDPELRDSILFDTPSVTPYKWYDFNDPSALNKILVKPRLEMAEPVDIVGESHIAKALQVKDRIQRVYAPSSDEAQRLHEILTRIKK